MASVSLQGISKRFGAVGVIADLDLNIESGEFMVLVGPSGCGKSTILRMIAGLEEPSRGTVLIGNRPVNNVSPKDRGVAMVFQNYALYPHMTVRENLAFSLKLSKQSKQEIEKQVEQAAQILGIGEHLEKKPAQLSGGQKQRVAMGRAMVRKPNVFLFDEPLSNLDAQLRIKMRAEISALHRQLKSTVVYVTHDQVEAMTLADRIAVLHQGKLEQVGQPLELYHQPRTKFVASFIGTPPMNFLPAEFLSGQFPNGTKMIGFRSEATRFGDSHNNGALLLGRGKVSLIEPLGVSANIHFQVNGHTVITESKAAELPRRDTEVGLFVKESALFFFDQTGNRIEQN